MFAIVNGTAAANPGVQMSPQYHCDLIPSPGQLHESVVAPGGSSSDSDGTQQMGKLVRVNLGGSQVSPPFSSPAVFQC